MSEEPVAEPCGDDRRAWVRYPCSLETLYQPGKGRLDHHWWFARVRDISSSGIGLILPQQFPPGTQLAIALHSSEQELSQTLEVNVVHVEPYEGGGWILGCTFVNQLSEDELRAYWSEQRLSQAVENLPDEASP